MSEIVRLLSMTLRAFLFLCMICGAAFMVILVIVVIRGTCTIIIEDLKRKKRQKANGGETE